MEPSAFLVDLKWEVKRRLQFIESSLFWRGRINRKSLVEHFGISGVQATNDIARYREIAPANMLYDAGQKTYLATDDFEARIITPETEILFYANDLVSKGVGDVVPWSSLPQIHRNVDYKTFRKILRATQDLSSIEILYQSMSKPAPTWRWISPHSFSHDGLRWHVRAYCFIDNSFKDFLLVRILETRKKRPGIIFIEEDEQWNNIVTLNIAAHPELSKAQKRVIEQDYCMVEGVLTVEIRQALLLYFLKRYNLLVEDPSSKIQQIVLINRDEFNILKT